MLTIAAYVKAQNTHCNPFLALLLWCFFGFGEDRKDTTLQMLYMQSIPSGKHGNTINTVFWFSSICHAIILRLNVSAVLERPHKLVTKLCKHKAHFQSLESSHRFNQRVYSSS